MLKSQFQRTGAARPLLPGTRTLGTFHDTQTPRITVSYIDHETKTSDEVALRGPRLLIRPCPTSIREITSQVTTRAGSDCCMYLHTDKLDFAGVLGKVLKCVLANRHQDIF